MALLSCLPPSSFPPLPPFFLHSLPLSSLWSSSLPPSLTPSSCLSFASLCYSLFSKREPLFRISPSNTYSAASPYKLYCSVLHDVIQTFRSSLYVISPLLSSEVILLFVKYKFLSFPVRVWWFHSLPSLNIHSSSSSLLFLNQLITESVSSLIPILNQIFIPLFILFIYLLTEYQVCSAIFLSLFSPSSEKYSHLFFTINISFTWFFLASCMPHRGEGVEEASGFFVLLSLLVVNIYRIVHSSRYTFIISYNEASCYLLFHCF